MRKFLRLIINIIDEVQKKKHENRLQNTFLSYSTNGIKQHVTACETLLLNSKNNQIIKNTKETVKKIIKKNLKTPENLLKYMEKSGTKIVKIKNADKILSFVGEQEGFILPKCGFEGLYLNLILNKKFSRKSPEMFVLRDLPLNIYALSHQFHKWYSYKQNLPGFDNSTVEKFKHIYDFENPNNVSKLSFKEIMGLKEAIKRDKEAIELVLELSREQEGTRVGLNKIKNGEKANI